MNVNIYLMVAFFMGLIGITLAVLQLIVCEYPRKKEASVGSDVTRLLMMIGFFVWVNVLQTTTWVAS